MSNLTEDDFALAGELALGLLDNTEAAQAEARCAVDAEFAAEVEAWRERLLPMLANVSDEPPLEAWHKIKSAIANSNTSAVAANDNNALRLWKGLTALSGAVAAALAVMLFIQPVNQPDTPVVAGNMQGNIPANEPKMVAALQSETGPSVATASYNPVSGELIITPVSMDTGDLYPEIWVIPADGTAHSLGVVARKGASRHNVDPKMRQYLSSGATIAITPEPAGGAPGGKATGPVMASGKITII